MERGLCIGLGSFGTTVKIEARVARPPKRCLSGQHYITGANLLVTREGMLLCRACRQQRNLRFYWAREMARYFASLEQAVSLATDAALDSREGSGLAGQPQEQPASAA